MVYANRNADQIILRHEYTALLDAYPDHFRVRHCLSQPAPQTASVTGQHARQRRTQVGEFS